MIGPSYAGKFLPSQFGRLPFCGICAAHVLGGIRTIGKHKSRHARPTTMSNVQAKRDSQHTGYTGMTTVSMRSRQSIAGLKHLLRRHSQFR
jgi:hypothetical protein